jgi:hypothetical protein
MAESSGFNIQNMCVTFVGYKDANRKGVFLMLG